MATDFEKALERIISEMPQTGLAETGKVRLMNRTDRKFLANKELMLKFLELTKDEYTVIVAAHSPVSVYSTVYYDTPDHRFYLLHHDNMRPRTKVRVRTYVDTGITFLEVKNKDNHGKTRKSRIEVETADVADEAEEEFLERKASVAASDLHPCLRNRFRRLTLVNKGLTERLTVDFDVSFKNLETGISRSLDNLVIIELKRSGKSESPATDALLRLRIKPRGFSKYCIGTMLTNPAAKYNRFKKKLTVMGKLGQPMARPAVAEAATAATLANA